MALRFETTAEEGVQSILGQYESQGFRSQFAARAGGMVHCFSCGDETPSDQVPLEALHRVEGVSDPDDEACVAAVECPACGVWGTLVLGYGTSASAEDSAVLANFIDDRAHSRIQQGM